MKKLNARVNLDNVVKMVNTKEYCQTTIPPGW